MIFLVINDLFAASFVRNPIDDSRSFLRIEVIYETCRYNHKKLLWKKKENEQNKHLRAIHSDTGNTKPLEMKDLKEQNWFKKWQVKYHRIINWSKQNSISNHQKHF